MAASRRVTSLVLADAGHDRPSWLEIDTRETGVTRLSEAFAKRCLPAPAIASLRERPGFYVCVDSIAAAIASVPGRPVGSSTLSGGMRELCVDTDGGMVVLAEVA